MDQATETAFIEMVGEGKEVAPFADGLLDELDDLDLSPSVLRSMMVVAARGLSEVFKYCFSGRPLDEKGLRIAGRRFVSVAWLLHSKMLVGENGVPLSLEQLSSLPQVDCSRCALSVLAQNFGKQWGFSSRVQKRKSSKANYARSAKTGWAARNLPTRKCYSCKLFKDRGEFSSAKARCRPCEKAHLAAKEKASAAKEQRESYRREPRCKTCGNEDLTQLFTRRNPSGEVVFRPLCRSCFNASRRRQPKEPSTV
jgi:hypothetical protein